MNDSSRAPLIGDRGILLHVGPHKTGTTAMQGAIYRAKSELRKHGITVPGRLHLQRSGARAVTAFTGTPGVEPPPAHAWDRLAALASAAERRAIIVSEYFDIADQPIAERIRDDLGADRLHVVITAAPLTSVMPANWQQRLRSGETRTFGDWLAWTLKRHDHDDHGIFWRRHRLDWQVETWSKTIGVDRVHVVIGDKTRPRLLFDGFEELLGAPEGILQPSPDTANRSLRWSEAEFLRQINLAAADWDDATQARFLRLGACREMLGRQEFGPADEPIRLTGELRERTMEVSRIIVDGLRASGVHVIGDLDTLLPSAPAVEEPQITPEVMDPTIAVRAVIGTARAGGAGILREKYVSSGDLLKYPGVSSATSDLLAEELLQRGPEATSTLVSQLDSDQLVAELRRRASSRARRVVQRVRRRATP